MLLIGFTFAKLQFAVLPFAIWGKNLGKKSGHIKALIEVSNNLIWGTV